MSDLDDTIRDALKEGESDHDPLADDREASLYEMVTDTYRGRLRWMVIAVTVYLLIFTVLTVLVGYRFFVVTEIKHQIMYASLFVACLQAVMMMKLWGWNLMNRNAVLREIKRLELHVARLAERSS